ncbi:MAG: hypothetical protein IM638_10730 [Bacteroidetes bacterium]|nr:hypothetical protein [Bacteroidota bacterium]
MKRKTKTKFAPIPWCTAKRYVKKWLQANPIGTTCYVELPYSDITNLIERNDLSNDSNAAIRIYLGINDEGKHTTVLIAARTAKNGTEEVGNDVTQYGENFGTLCPPYNFQSDAQSLASVAMNELINPDINIDPRCEEETITKKKVSKKK